MSRDLSRQNARKGFRHALTSASNALWSATRWGMDANCSDTEIAELADMAKRLDLTKARHEGAEE